MDNSRALAIASSSALLALALAVGQVGSPASASTPPTVKAGGVLHVLMPWTSIPDNFNPLNPGGTAATAGGTGSAIYEPLVYVNPYTGRDTNVLGTSYAWSNGYKTLTVTTRQGVKWDDGTDFSANDVAFTFNLLKKYPKLDVNGLFTSEHLLSVTATSTDVVVFAFSSPYTTAFDQIAGQSIVPEHIWSKVANPITFANASDPVGTGPFELKQYTKTTVTYKKNPHYWMPGRPYISGLTMTAVKSASMAAELVGTGVGAETYGPIVDPQQSFIALDAASNGYWWPEVNLNVLDFNNTKAPFNALSIRKAVAEAIGTDALAQRAYYGSIPAANETAVTTGQLSQWVPSSVKALQWAQNTSKALTMLAAHGYKVVDGHLDTPAGNALPTFKILIGEGWSDYISIAQTISQDLQSVGISTTLDEAPLAEYQADLQHGDYTLAISWTADGGESPYYLYKGLFGTPASHGTVAAGADWERFSSPQVDAALQRYNSTSDPSTLKAAMTTIEKSVLQNVPVVPLTGRPNFLEYSTHYFTGWPSSSNPYDAAESPDAFGGGAEQVFLNVHRS